MSDVESDPVVTEEPVVVPKTKKARKKVVKVAEPEVEAPAPTKKGRKKVAAAKAAVADTPVKTSRGNKMSETEKKSLSDHMGTQEGTVTEIRSQRMKLMSRMRKGMTLEEAQKDIA